MRTFVQSNSALIALVVSLSTAVPYGTNLASAAESDAFPRRPVRVVLPYPPGGSTDPMARLLGSALGEVWRQPIVIDHRPGAGGTIANELVAKSSADGHTLLLGTLGTVAIAPALYSGSVDAGKNLAAVAHVASGYYLLAVAQSSPATSVRELVALARSKPGQLSYGSGGTGSPPHLAMELLKQTAQIDLVHVPYKGTGPVLTDLMAGRIAAGFGSAVSVLPQAKAEKVRVLAATSLRRSAILPDIPTIAESGYPGFEVDAWYGIFAHAATPPALIAQLHKSIHAIVTRADMRERYAAMGIDASAASQAEFAARVVRDSEKWGTVTKKLGIRVD
jgi:tripartite-type tricarboxylate transporter receptor subunit TctC